MMDGGRGQVNIALEVLGKLNLQIPVCGMVKDDKHRTRGLYFNNKEIPIDRDSEGFKLITRIQDEAHRFAIEYHRSLRSQGQVRSVLDDIEGIGPARRKTLMRRFKSLEAIRDASLEELSSTISETALCGLGKSAPSPVSSTLKYFRDEYLAHVADKKCPAGQCKALVTLQIDPELCRGCTKCARLCPVGAISGSVKQPHVIDTDKCIKCRACLDGCSFGAVKEV